MEHGKELCMFAEELNGEADRATRLVSSTSSIKQDPEIDVKVYSIETVADEDRMPVYPRYSLEPCNSSTEAHSSIEGNAMAIARSSNDLVYGNTPRGTNEVEEPADGPRSSVSPMDGVEDESFMRRWNKRNKSYSMRPGSLSLFCTVPDCDRATRGFAYPKHYHAHIWIEHGHLQAVMGKPLGTI
jgi:hypothetical protein